MTRPARELNLDGLVGPTHHFGGLAVGNLASRRHRHLVSHPKQAALQGLDKMKMLADLGIAQAVLPPQDRPDLATLRRLGFTGSDAQVLERTGREDPVLLSGVSSASAMWAANAATVSPSADTRDGRVHITAANLTTNLHRHIEPAGTARALQAAFADPAMFCHHDALPSTQELGDEGAANHMRICATHGRPGIEVFVYGKADGHAVTGTHPARQMLAASKAIARLHGLASGRVIFVQQSPEAIDAGAFHNDVVAVANGRVLLYHEQAFVDSKAAVQQIRRAYAGLSTDELFTIGVTADELPLADAVATYLFNSQLVTLPGGEMALICPVECQESNAARGVIDCWVAGDNPIGSARYVDLRQSMRNGGGPACLRLRVTLTDEQFGRTHQGLILTQALYDALTDWVRRHYRDELTVDDLADPALRDQCRSALDELTGLLGLGSFYNFQKQVG